MATVLVTGGSSGIGLATVRRLAAAGDRVFCASRHPEATPLPADVVAPAPFAGWYSASKAALASLSTVFGAELHGTERLRGRNAEALQDAGDADEVARAIEECLRVSEPPARVVVGQDGAAMEQTVRQSSAEKLAMLLRDYVAGLMA